MSDLKIFFHDRCIDGAATAAVFANFYRKTFDAQVAIEFQGLVHCADPFRDIVFGKGDNACVDFRYCTDDRMNWWIDHHQSAFQPEALRTHFDHSDKKQKIFDPTAPSCVGLACRALGALYDYRPDFVSMDFIRWADVIDSAGFSSAKEAVSLDIPAMVLSAWISECRDSGKKQRFIESLGSCDLADLAQQRWLKDDVDDIRSRRSTEIALVQSVAKVVGTVTIVDLVDCKGNVQNKFIPYFLLPQCLYAMYVCREEDSIKISVGINPWAKQSASHNIASICERYGGGGHSYVGGIGLSDQDELAVQRVIREIWTELNSPVDMRSRQATQ